MAIKDSKQGLYAMTNLSAGVSILKSDYLVSELSGQYTCETSNAQGSNSVSTTLQGTFSEAKKAIQMKEYFISLQLLHSPHPSVYKVCEVNPCLNGGTCIPDKSGQALCLCSESNSGDYCENGEYAVRA